MENSFFCGITREENWRLIEEPQGAILCHMGYERLWIWKEYEQQGNEEGMSHTVVYGMLSLAHRSRIVAIIFY